MKNTQSIQSNDNQQAERPRPASNGMRLLVSGGAGFIGSNFIRYMLATYPDVEIVNFDKLTYACNLDKLNAVIKKYQIDHIINFAAETHVDRSIHGGCKDFVLTNTLGVQMLLDAVRANNIEKMVNVSTDEVYGALRLDDPSKFSEHTPV